MLEWIGLNFYYNDGLQPKMRAKIINEHECTSHLDQLTPLTPLATHSLGLDNDGSVKSKRHEVKSPQLIFCYYK